jgi:hypothetical protein
MWGHHAENYRLTYFSGFKKKIKNITVIDEFSNVLGCIFKHPKKIREFYRPERYENEDGFIVEVKETEKDVAKKIDDFLKADEKIYQGGLEKDNLNEKEKEIHDMSLEDLNATYDKILLFFQKMHYHLEEEIKRMHSTHRITYILTVPTNWSDYALEGIRQIALKANFVKEKDHERRFWIRRNNITTRLGLYYSNGDQSLLKRGFGHLVCDVGGTSTTIDAFQISGTHKELKIGDNGYKDILKKSIPRHYNFGSNDLDDNMEILLVDHLFGSNRDISVVNKYKRDIFECLRQFQIEYKARFCIFFINKTQV